MVLHYMIFFNNILEEYSVYLHLVCMTLEGVSWFLPASLTADLDDNFKTKIVFVL